MWFFLACLLYSKHVVLQVPYLHVQLLSKQMLLRPPTSSKYYGFNKKHFLFDFAKT